MGPIPAALVVLATFAAWRFPITPEVHAKRRSGGLGLQSSLNPERLVEFVALYMMMMAAMMLVIMSMMLVVFALKLLWAVLLRPVV